MVKNIALFVFPAALLLLVLSLRVYLAGALARQALLSLIRRFRELGASDPGAAVSAAELGLRTANPEGDWLKSAAASSSYRPRALLQLIAWEAVKVTMDQRYYLAHNYRALLGLR